MAFCPPVLYLSARSDGVVEADAVGVYRHAIDQSSASRQQERQRSGDSMAAAREVCAPQGSGTRARWKTKAQEAVAAVVAQLSQHSRELLARRIRSHTWRVSSACTGSGMAEVAFCGVVGHFNGKVQVDFCCERSISKQAFLKHIVEPNLGSGTFCMYDELHDLHTGAGACAAHMSRCGVRRHSDLFTCGFSCKDFSKLSGTFGKSERKRILQDALGTSGGTFRAMVAHVKCARPRIVILENVDQIGKLDSPNVIYLWEVFRSMGYGGSMRALCSSHFGSPQRRRRVYFILLDVGAHGLSLSEAVSKAESVFNDMEQLKCAPEPLRNFIMDSESQYVQSELARRQASRRGDSHQATSWRRTHRRFLQAKGLSGQHAALPRDVRSSPWFDLLPSREKEVLAFCLRQWPCATSFDLSARIDRVSVGRDLLVPTVTPRGKPWLRQLDQEAKQISPNRVMLGREALAIQGFPVEWLGSRRQGSWAPSDRLLSDLAGNAFTGQVLSKLFIAIFLHL